MFCDIYIYIYKISLIFTLTISLFHYSNWQESKKDVANNQSGDSTSTAFVQSSFDTFFASSSAGKGPEEVSTVGTFSLKK